MRKQLANVMVGVVAVSVVSITTGCGVVGTDYVVMASAEGLRAHGETLNGLGSKKRGEDFNTTRQGYNMEVTERTKCDWAGKIASVVTGRPCGGATPRMTSSAPSGGAPATEED